ncbi:MAG: iron-sulfur cluster assembly scaffold protein [Planctomycetota bacterium]|jgi:NifU-like protein involved in Fe-S cluster formation
MKEALRAVMLRGEGAGELAGTDVRTGAAEHPVCGDVVEVDCRLPGGRILELAWRAQGCPATLAVAASASKALLGRRAQDAPGLLRQRLQELGGLDAEEHHAERLFLLALSRAAADGTAVG